MKPKPPTEYAEFKVDVSPHTEQRQSAAAANADAHIDNIALTFAGMSLFGGVYGATFMLLQNLFEGEDILTAIVEVNVAAVIGAIVIANAGLLAIAFVLLLNWSFGFFLRGETATCVTAGLAAFLSTCWMVNSDGLRDPWMVEQTLFGPVLAMTIVQWGTMWMIVRFGDRPNANKFPPYQFQISHILAATAWVAFVLALHRLLPRSNVSMLVLMWVILQAISVLIVKSAIGRVSIDEPTY